MFRVVGCWAGIGVTGVFEVWIEVVGIGVTGVFEVWIEVVGVFGACLLAIGG